MRHADELSITITPAAAIFGAKTLDEVAPEDVSAMSIPEKSAVAASSTTIAVPFHSSVEPADLAAAGECCDQVKNEIGAADVTTDDSIGRVSIVGAGMKSNPGVTALMFETLSQHGINIEMISTSSIRISCVIRADKVNDAVRYLHTAFGLDAA